jgi:undecaprenyl pyrophosphate synthase
VQLVLKTPSLDQTLATAVAVAVAVGIQLAELVVRVAEEQAHPPARVQALMELRTQAAAVVVELPDVCSAVRAEAAL